MTPCGRKLLDEPLVRCGATHGGGRTCCRDLCIHRGTALSLGRIEVGEIVCPYHGWQYGRGRRCTRDPAARADPTRVPAKARMARFALPRALRADLGRAGGAALALPEVPELEDPAAGSWSTPARTRGRSDASRQLENFTDFGHFPWVHPGLLGDPSRPVVPEHTVETDGHVLRLPDRPPGGANQRRLPGLRQRVRRSAERRSRYQLHLPYTIVLRLGWGGEKGMVYFFASQPISAERCAGYVVMARNYDLDQPPAVLQEFEDTIFNQDQRVVESQRPEQVPFDLADELHLKFDAVAVAYRRAMRAQGLATSAARD